MKRYKLLVLGSVLSLLSSASVGADFGTLSQQKEIKVAGFWDGLKGAVSKMGDDLGNAISGHGQTSQGSAIDQLVNSSPPPAAGRKTTAARVDIREIQARLSALGYSPGPVDGVFGKKTAAAIAMFQRAQGLPVDGRPTERLIAELRSRSDVSGNDSQLAAKLGGAAIAAGIAAGSIATGGLAAVVLGSGVSSLGAGNAPIGNPPSTASNIIRPFPLASSKATVPLSADSRPASVAREMIAQGLGTASGHSSQDHPMRLGASRLAREVGMRARTDSQASYSKTQSLLHQIARNSHPKSGSYLDRMVAQQNQMIVDHVRNLDPAQLEAARKAGLDVDGMIAKQLGHYVKYQQDSAAIDRLVPKGGKEPRSTMQKNEMLTPQIAGYPYNLERGRLEKEHQPGHTIKHSQVSKSASKGGPVAYWNFEEGTGPMTTDIIGGITVFNLGSQFSNEPAPNGGSSSLYCSSGRSSGSVGEKLMFNLNEESFSISAWAKSSSMSKAAWEQQIVSIGPNASGTGQAYWLSMFNGGEFGIQIGTATPLRISNGKGTSIVDGQYHHLLGVHDAQNKQIRLYVDGSLAAQASTSSISGTVGGFNVWFCRSNNLYVDEIKVYNRTVSAKEALGVSNPPALGQRESYRSFEKREEASIRPPRDQRVKGQTPLQKAHGQTAKSEETGTKTFSLAQSNVSRSSKKSKETSIPSPHEDLARARPPFQSDKPSSPAKAYLDIESLPPSAIPKDKLLLTSFGHLLADDILQDVFAHERNTYERAGWMNGRFGDDKCFYGAMTAALKGANQNIISNTINDLAVDITFAALGASTVEGEFRKALYKFLLDIGSAYLKESDLDVAASRSLFERTFGYVFPILAQLDPDILPDHLFVSAGEQLSKLAVGKIIKEQDVTSGQFSIDNSGTRGFSSGFAPLTNASITWLYSPKTHYMVAYVAANCEGIGNRLYYMRFEVEKSGKGFGRTANLNTLKIFRYE